jgi:hypothetical protein
MTALEIVDLPADRLPGEALAVLLFEDQRPLTGPVAVVDWRLDGALTRMLLAGELSGRNGERLVIQTNHKFAAPWVLLAGCGPQRALDRSGYVLLVERLLKVATRAGIGELALCLPTAGHIDAPELERIVREALIGSGRLAVCRLSRVAHLT